MKKVLLDTNIYGEIVKEKDPYKILESISLQKKFVFYRIKNVITGFFVVACASLKRMDIVVSNDNHTMLTENAIRAYNLINKTKNIRIPWFINYLEFRRRLFSL